jgi:acetyl esterase/lipase
VIVFIHGGAWRAGSKEQGRGSAIRFLGTGEYAGISVGYRLTDEAKWPAQIHDCKAAIRWIRAHAKEHGLDGGKIAVWGSSAGGHLVSMLGTSGGVAELEGDLGPDTGQSSRVTCVINFFGPQDFITMVRQPSTMDRSKGDYPEARLLGGTVQDNPDAARAASPVTYASPDDPPFLTAHGTKDTTVPYGQAEAIHEALRKAGASSILIPMEGGGHGFQSGELDKRLRAFLDKHLRGVEAEIPSTPIPVTPRR